MNALLRRKLELGFLCLLSCLGPLHCGAQVPFPQPGTGTPISTPVTLIANGGDVKVTFQANTATYDDYLFLFAPAPAWPFQAPPTTGNYIFWNHDPNLTAGSSTIDLGIFPAGTELVFGEYVRNTGQIFYSGLGSRNPDGDVHAYIIGTGQDTVFVGFEDLLASAPSDFNYNDITFTMENLNAVVVPEPGAVSLICGGLITAGIWRATRKGRSN